MNVIFVCTTPSFRGLAAEYSLKKYCQEHDMNHIFVSSAILESGVYEPETTAIITLSSLHIQVDEYTPLHLTKEAVDKSVVIALDEKARNKVQEQFGKLIPLFNEVAYEEHTSVESLDELDEQENKIVYDNHIVTTINYIYESMDNLVKNLEHYNH